MKNLCILFCCVIAPYLAWTEGIEPATSQNPSPVAILAFQERGLGLKGYGEKVGDLLFASLVARPELLIVERTEIEKLLQEAELNLSGAVSPAQATQVGQLTGAKILITGSVIESDKTVYLVAKIIGTETSRVLGKSVKGSMSGELAPLVEDLAGQIAETVTSRSDQLVVQSLPVADRVGALKARLGEAKRPKLFISVAEHHVGQVTIDPAAETELMRLAKETGFVVMDTASGSEAEADIVLKGEGFSEFAMRRGNLVSVRARVELKAVDQKTREVLVSDRQTVRVVDLSEQIAGKSALQEAATQLAERVFPRLIR